MTFYVSLVWYLYEIIFQLTKYPLICYVQIFDLFDVKKKGVIDFEDFVRSLNVFHPNASLEDKIACKLKFKSSTRDLSEILYRYLSCSDTLGWFGILFQFHLGSMICTILAL